MPVYSNFHHIELSAGLGFPWLLNTSVSIRPVYNIFIRGSASTMVLATNYSAIIGYQYKINDNINNNIRIGIGYSYTDVVTFYDIRNNIKDGLVLHLSGIGYSKKHLAINPGFSFISYKNRFIPSINIDLSLCLL